MLMMLLKCSKYDRYLHMILYADDIIFVDSIVTELDKSPLPLTDPHDAVPRAHRAVYRCRRSM